MQDLRLSEGGRIQSGFHETCDNKVPCYPVPATHLLPFWLLDIEIFIFEFYIRECIWSSWVCQMWNILNAKVAVFYGLMDNILLVDVKHMERFCKQEHYHTWPYFVAGLHGYIWH